MIVCIFERVQWRRALNDSLAPRLGLAAVIVGVFYLVFLVLPTNEIY
jgi:hypothetical protein